MINLIEKSNRYDKVFPSIISLLNTKYSKIYMMIADLVFYPNRTKKIDRETFLQRFETAVDTVKASGFELPSGSSDTSSLIMLMMDRKSTFNWFHSEEDDTDKDNQFFSLPQHVVELLNMLDKTDDEKMSSISDITFKNILNEAEKFALALINDNEAIRSNLVKQREEIDRKIRDIDEGKLQDIFTKNELKKKMDYILSQIGDMTPALVMLDNNMKNVNEEITIKINTSDKSIGEIINDAYSDKYDLYLDTMNGQAFNDLLTLRGNGYFEDLSRYIEIIHKSEIIDKDIRVGFYESFKNRWKQVESMVPRIRQSDEKISNSIDAIYKIKKVENQSSLQNVLKSSLEAFREGVEKGVITESTKFTFESLTNKSETFSVPGIAKDLVPPEAPKPLEVIEEFFINEDDEDSKFNVSFFTEIWQELKLKTVNKSTFNLNTEWNDLDAKIKSGRDYNTIRAIFSDYAIEDIEGPKIVYFIYEDIIDKWRTDVDLLVDTSVFEKYEIKEQL